MPDEYLNMVLAAQNQSPTDFSDSFNTIFMDKVANAINNKKIDFAKGMYGSKAVEDINLETDSED